MLHVQMSLFGLRLETCLALSKSFCFGFALYLFVLNALCQTAKQLEINKEETQLAVLADYLISFFRTFPRKKNGLHLLQPTLNFFYIKFSNLLSVVN